MRLLELAQLCHELRRPRLGVGGEADERRALSRELLQRDLAPRAVWIAELGVGDDLGLLGQLVARLVDHAAATLDGSRLECGLLEQCRIGSLGIEGVVGRGYGSEGCSIVWIEWGEVAARADGLQQGEAGRGALGVGVDEALGELLLECRDEL